MSQLDKTIVRKIDRMFLIYGYSLVIGYFTSFLVLAFLGLLNSNTFTFLVISFMFMLFNGRKILRTYLSKQDQQELDQLERL